MSAVRLEMREKEKEQGRFHTTHIPNLLVSIWRDVTFKQIYEITSGETFKKGNWINTVEIFCTDPSREEEFNNWYNNTHLPDVLSTPGFLSARRYIIKEPRNGRGKYLSIYEIATDDIDRSIALRREKREKEKEQGRSASVVIPGLILHAWQDVLFRQIYELTSDR